MATLFEDDFEGGVFRPQWTITGTGNHRTQITNQQTPRDGFHMLMDAHVSGLLSRNEATLSLDLTGQPLVTQCGLEHHRVAGLTRHARHHHGGAVAFLPTLITAPWPQLLQQVQQVARWLETWNGNGAEPLGLHLEGPFLVTPGAHPKQHFVPPTAERVAELLAAARGKLRLVTIGNAIEGAAEAIRQLVAAGVTVALGHCDRGDGFAACVDAGATSVTHLFNVMGPMHHRVLGPATLALDDVRVSCPIIVDGVHVAEAMVRNAFQILGPDRMILVTDAVAAAGMPDGTYSLSGIEVTASAGVVRDGQGNLAGSALTMALCARNFLSFVPSAGPWTLAQIASSNPARLIGASDYGTLRVGGRAAFTLLGDDGSVRCVR